MALRNAFLDDVCLLCFVCGDLDAAVRRYADELGVGPWQVFDFAPPLLRGTEIAGKPAAYSMRVAFASVGDMGWALLEPKTGPTIYSDFYRRQGNGLHHAAFLHAALSYDACIAEFAGRGFPLTQRGDYYGRYCYLDTRERAHLVFELIENPDAVMQDVAYRYPSEGALAARPLFDRTVSVGLVTADLDASLATYTEGLGIGPWSLYEPASRREPRRAVARIGRCHWELIEPGEGPSSNRQRLDRLGPGAHHVGVTCSRSSFDAAIAALRSRGIGSLDASAGRARAAYLDTEALMGLRLKLFEGNRYPDPASPDRVFPARS